MPAKLFERPGEPSQAWHAFTVYRDMGFKRSLARVTLRLVQDKLQHPDEHLGSGETGNPRSLIVIDSDKPGHEQAMGRLQKSASGHVGIWSRKWQWVGRAAAWDDEVDRHVRQRTNRGSERVKPSRAPR